MEVRKNILLVGLLAVLVLLPLKSSRGQMIVSDPTLVATNTVGFLTSLLEAIEQTTTSVSQLGEAATSVALIKQMVKVITEIQTYISDAQEISEAVLMVSDITQSLYKFLNFCTQSGVVNMAEMTEVLDYYTETLRECTNIVQTIKKVVLSKSSDLTAAERFKMLREDLEKLKSIKERNEGNIARVQSIVAQRVELKNAVKKGYISNPMEAVLAVKKDDGVPPSAAMNKVLNGMFTATGASGSDEDTLESGTQWFFKLFYAVCFIIGAIGAYKVYVKVQLGEDFTKSAWTWLGTALALFVGAMLVNAFFFGDNVEGGGLTVKTVGDKLLDLGEVLQSFLYACAAISGLVGGIQIYARWNSGDPEAPRKVGVWIGVAIFLLAAGVILGIFIPE